MLARFLCLLLVAFPLLAGAADTLVLTSRATGTLYIPGVSPYAYSLALTSHVPPGSIERRSDDIVFSEYGPATLTLNYDGRTEIWSDPWYPGTGLTWGRMSPGDPVTNTGDSFSHEFWFMLTRDNYSAEGVVVLTMPRGTFPGILDFVPQAFTVTDPDDAGLIINMRMSTERVEQWYGTVDSFSLSISPVPEPRAMHILPAGLAVLLVAGWRQRQRTPVWPPHPAAAPPSHARAG